MNNIYYKTIIMKRIVRLTESDLSRIIRRVINESEMSEEILDLDEIGKTGGVGLTDGNGTSILLGTPEFYEFRDGIGRRFIIKSKPRQFDYDETLTLQIAGLKADSAKIIGNFNEYGRLGSVRPNIDLDIVHGGSGIRIPLDVIKEWPKGGQVITIEVTGNVPNRKFVASVQLIKSTRKEE